MKYNEMFAIYKFLRESKGNDSPAWKEAINNLGMLMEHMGVYETKRQDGSYLPINEKEYKKINGMLDKAVTSVKNYLKENENVHDDRTDLTKNLEKEFLSKTYVEFKNVKPNPNVSLHESMENFRYEEVQLSNADLKRVGANLSSRIQLSVDINGEKVKGVFTPKSTYNPKERYEEILDEMKLKYPMYTSFWNTFYNNDHFYKQGLTGLTTNMLTNLDTWKAKDKTDAMALKTLNRYESSSFINGNKVIDDEYKKFKTDPAFFGAIYDFSSKIEKFKTYRGVNTMDVSIEDGQNIDVRNCAMSSVAHLLGEDDLIAKAKQVTIKMPNGKYQLGTFMEYAKGKDVMNLDSIDSMKALPKDAFDTVSLKTQLANLQVLDYICGNIDRHVGNMFYDVDPKTRKVVGIKGIDNDASFMSREIKKGEQAGRLCSIRDMRVIDEDMANRVLEIDEGALSATLHGYGLTVKEVKAAWNRLVKLQDAIREAKTYNPKEGLPKIDYSMSDDKGLMIVKKGDWDKLPMSDLQREGGRSYFVTAGFANDIANRQLAATADFKKSAEASRVSLKTMLDPKNTKAMIDNARSDKPVIGVSKRYSDVLKALDAYQRTPAPADVLARGDDPKWTALNNLKAAVDAYKSEKVRIGHIDEQGKILQNFKGKPLKRIHDVDMIGKFTDKLLEQRKLALQTNKDLEKAIEKDKKTIEFNSKSFEEKNQIINNQLQEEQNKNQDLSTSILNDINKDNDFVKNEQAIDNDYKEIKYDDEVAMGEK